MALACSLAWSLSSAACSSPPPADSNASCTQGDELVQRFGTDCTCCHAEFGVAGSVDHTGPRIARIVVVGADGQSSEMAPNEFGNFFRHLQLKPPLRASVVGVDGRVATMAADAPGGGCNSCHGGSTPRIRAP